MLTGSASCLCSLTFEKTRREGILIGSASCLCSKTFEERRREADEIKNPRRPERAKTFILLCFFKVSVAWARLGGPKTFIFLGSEGSGRLWEPRGARGAHPEPMVFQNHRSRSKTHPEPPALQNHSSKTPPEPLALPNHS